KNPHAKIFYIRRQKEPGRPKEEIYSNSKIVQVIKTLWELGHEHKFITEIVARRANDCIVSITEPDYKNLNKNDIEDMYLMIMNNKVPDYANTGLLWSLSVFIRSSVIWERVHDFQLGIESYQQTINLTAPTITFLGIEEYNVFSIVYEPVHGIIYANSKKEKRVMRPSEIHKFCDATLRRTLEGLKSYYNDVKYGYVQKELTNDEVEFLKLFEEDIEVLFELSRSNEKMRDFKPPSRSYVQMRADGSCCIEWKQLRRRNMIFSLWGAKDLEGHASVLRRVHGPTSLGSDELLVLGRSTATMYSDPHACLPAQVIPDPHAEAISVSSSDEEVEPLTSNLVRGSRFLILDDDTLTSTTGVPKHPASFPASTVSVHPSNEGRGPVRLFARGGNWTRGTLIDAPPKTTFAAPAAAAAASNQLAVDDRGAGTAFASLRTPIDAPPKPTSELPGFATPAAAAPAAAAGINLREATLQPSTRAPAQFLKIDAELRNDITGIKVLSGTCEFLVPREGHYWCSGKRWNQFYGFADDPGVGWVLISGESNTGGTGGA
ncbi:hypothetical protein Tco_0827261, partial [Tanacetum coccineum]